MKSSENKIKNVGHNFRLWSVAGFNGNQTLDNYSPFSYPLYGEQFKRAHNFIEFIQFIRFLQVISFIFSESYR